MAVQKTNSMKRQPKSAARESADIGGLTPVWWTP